MRIKTKLTLGIGLLFALIMVLAVMGTLYINVLKKDTQNILVSNYGTLEYTRKMMLALDAIQATRTAFPQFEQNLTHQLQNVTEPGEREATQQLAEHYQQLKMSPAGSALPSLIRQDLSQIMLLNMQAIQRKSDIASQTADTATLWIATAGTLCFIIAFVLLVNLPGNIANPIRELTESIKQIAHKNYAQRVHFSKKNEFGELAGSFNIMAEKLEEYDNSNLSKLLIEKKRIEALINNMHDPVIGLDENRKILFVNDAALNIIGIPAGRLIGQTAQDIAVTNDLIRSLTQQLMQPGATIPEDKGLKIYANGRESYFEKNIITISITPTGEQNQKLIGHVILLRNITPYKELDFAKTNFIATVSHELKTPISSIKLGVQLLEKKETGSLNEEQQQLLESIKDDAGRLLKITGELLNLSQVETGNIQLNLQPANANNILQYALDAIKVQADLKEIELHIRSGRELPLIKADEEKTAWVLINFLTNAIRYSPEKTRIQITTEIKGDQLLFSVTDKGYGIDPAYKNRIFDRYFQIPGSSKSGTGLGLAICKEFIEAQGGSIGVETEPGIGSTFYFLLPVER